MMTTDDLKDARKYAWDYFALHADQRMKLFNFFLILSGLILGAFPAVKSMADGTKVVVFPPLLLTLTAFVFWRLDERTRSLVKNGEDALRFLDEKLPVEPMSGGSPHYLQLIQRDDHLRELKKNAANSCWLKRLVPISYAQSFRIAFLMIGGIGVVLATWVLVE